MVFWQNYLDHKRNACRYSTAIDMSKYVKFLMKPDTRFLSQASVSEWIHVNTLFPDNKGAGFALPWELDPITTSSNTTSILITKGGLVGTYETFIAFHPDTEVGIVVLTSYGPNTTQDPVTLGTSILADFIPVVEAANFAIISPSYTGVYICEHTAPIVSPDLNATVEVLHGRIEVTGSASQGLRAFVNVTSKEGGTATSQVFQAFLLLKNGTDNTFWANPTFSSGTWNDCQYLAMSLTSGPDISRPNVPGTLYYYEIQFDPPSHLLRWPSWGAVCRKS